MKTRKTKVGKFLQTIGKPVDAILDVVGDITGIESLDKLGDAISGSQELSSQDKEIALALLKADRDDLANARNMQVAALEQNDLFSKRFIYYLALFWSIIAAGFIFGVMFIEIPQNNIRLIDTISGFLLGTIVAGIIQFFFGSSQGSSEKNKLIEKLKGTYK